MARPRFLFGWRERPRPAPAGRRGGWPGAEPRDEQALRAVLGSRLTKAQILGTIELLETYRNHCEYNVGVGPLLGGLAVELEEIL